MFQNKIAYLGLLGFLFVPALLIYDGFVVWFFLCFFSFFSYAKKPFDELARSQFKTALCRAGATYFVLNMAVFAYLGLARYYGFGGAEVLQYLSSYRVFNLISWVASGVFVFSNTVFESREKKLMKEPDEVPVLEGEVSVNGQK